MNVSRRAAGAFVTSLLILASGLVFSAPVQAADDPHIYGYVTGVSRKGNSVAAKTMTVRLFRSDADDSNWRYLRSVKVKASGIYDVATDGPGRYHLQLVDRRPSYDVNSWARVPNVNVTVPASGAVKNVSVRVGGALYGGVKVRGKKASSALVRAISDDGQVYESRTDRSGKYALGGLPKNNYRVFAYDAAKRRVGKSKLVRRVTLRSFRKASFDLRTRPSEYRGFLRLGGKLASKSVTVTAVNRRTGEYWVQKVSNGALSLRGLTAGSYTVTVPDTQGYFGRTVNVPSVGTGKRRTIDINLTTMGGTFTGTVVDAVSGQPIPNISIQLKDSSGKVQQEITASAAGVFRLGGTLRAQSGMTVTIFAYDKIGEHFYESRTFSGLTVADNQTVDLNLLSSDTVDGAAVIKLPRKSVSAPPPVVVPPVTVPAP